MSFVVLASDVQSTSPASFLLMRCEENNAAAIPDACVNIVDVAAVAFKRPLKDYASS
jgi:hypothetical protein